MRLGLTFITGLDHTRYSLVLSCAPEVSSVLIVVQKSTKTNGNNGSESPSPSIASSRSSSPIPPGHDDQNGLAEYARKRRELLRLARALANLG